MGGEGLRRAFCTNVSLLKETDSNVFYYYCESNSREVLESAQQGENTSPSILPRN